MKIKGIPVGNVVLASGVGNFHGEGYPYHTYLFFFFLFSFITVPICRLMKSVDKLMDWIKKKNENLFQFIDMSHEMPLMPFIFSFKGTVFTTKTIPLHSRVGNMKVKKDGITPKDMFPSCIYVDMKKKIGVNNVALTCPGLHELMKQGKLQKIKKTFFFSTMPLGATKEERLAEIREIIETLEGKLQYNFRAQLIIQFNISCPNTGHELESYLQEVKSWLAICDEAGFGTSLKINTLTPIETTLELMKYADALFISNTYPVANLTREEKIELFGSEVTPLEKYQDEFNVKGLGGVSGAFLFNKVYDYIKELRKLGMNKPIIFGGGILCREHVRRAKEAGATGISPGSVVMIAPWNLREVINAGNEFFPMQYQYN